MNTPAEIANIYSDVGAKKTKQPLLKLFVLSLFAGAFIALGGMGSAIASCGVQAGLGRFLSGIVFPVGLVMVVVAGSELFTGNCLIIISVLQKKATWLGFLYNLVVVWIGNFIGALLIVILSTYGGVFSLFNGDLAKAVVATAVSKVHLSFTAAFFKGILCNIMVCIAVWMSFAPKDISGKILAAFLPIVVFVICGFEHCVANFYFIPAGIFVSKLYNLTAEGLNWISFFITNELPVTLGNIVGGSVLVGIGYWYTYLQGKKE